MYLNFKWRILKNIKLLPSKISGIYDTESIFFVTFDIENKNMTNEWTWVIHNGALSLSLFNYVSSTCLSVFLYLSNTHWHTQSHTVYLALFLKLCTVLASRFPFFSRILFRSLSACLTALPLSVSINSAQFSLNTSFSFNLSLSVCLSLLLLPCLALCLSCLSLPLHLSQFLSLLTLHSRA